MSVDFISIDFNRIFCASGAIIQFRPSDAREFRVGHKTHVPLFNGHVHRFEFKLWSKIHEMVDFAAEQFGHRLSFRLFSKRFPNNCGIILAVFLTHSGVRFLFLAPRLKLITEIIVIVIIVMHGTFASCSTKIIQTFLIRIVGNRERNKSIFFVCLCW